MSDNTERLIVRLSVPFDDENRQAAGCQTLRNRLSLGPLTKIPDPNPEIGLCADDTAVHFHPGKPLGKRSLDAAGILQRYERSDLDRESRRPPEWDPSRGNRGPGDGQPDACDPRPDHAK